MGQTQRRQGRTPKDCDRPLSAEPSTQEVATIEPPLQKALASAPSQVGHMQAVSGGLGQLRQDHRTRTAGQHALRRPGKPVGFRCEGLIAGHFTLGAQPGCLLVKVCHAWDSSPRIRRSVPQGLFYIMNFCLKTERCQQAPGNSGLQLLEMCGYGLPATTGAGQPGGLSLRQLVHSHVLPAGQASALLLLEGSVGATGPGGTGGGPAAMGSRGYSLWFLKAQSSLVAPAGS